LLVRGQVGATTVDDDGCRFSAVEENGPAYKAGLRVGDVVLRVDGRDIKAAATFQRWLAEAEPGETLSLEVKRGAQTLTLEMKLDVPAKKN